MIRREVIHRHIDHTDLTIHRDGHEPTTVATREELDALLLEANGLRPVFCNLYGAVVDVETAGDYGTIVQECLGNHWRHIETHITDEEELDR